VAVRPSCPPDCQSAWDHPGARAPQNLEQCDENYEALILEPGQTIITSGNPDRGGALGCGRIVASDNKAPNLLVNLA
jgi:hypothetical protein